MAIRSPYVPDDANGSTVADDYAGPPPPWDIGCAQPALRRLADQGLLTGRLLDVGCGTGEHALLAASLGFPATGIDLSRNAIEIAGRKAAERGLAARFVVGSVFELDQLDEQYETVLDCGLFHNLHPRDRGVFQAALSASVPAGGKYFLLGFNDLITTPTTPYKLTEAEIIETFRPNWHVRRIEPDSIHVRTGCPVPAWLAALERR
jgi:2-polyprenyl-3-methyl-5-hydroxy-6-metoxy-1,4-benzoquinol methylase